MCVNECTVVPVLFHRKETYFKSKKSTWEGRDILLFLVIRSHKV